MYIKIHNGTPKGGNKGSVSKLATYLEKEGRGEFFTHDKMNIPKHEVVHTLDNNKAKLGKDDAKFYMVTINPSFDEINHLKKTNADIRPALRDYTNQVMDEYAKSFNRDKVKSNKDLVYYAKIEKYRYYKGSDKEVISGKAKSGERKPGENWHIHVMVSRKDKSNTVKLSPSANERKKDRKIGNNNYRVGFDRAVFRLKSEKAFDVSNSYYRDPSTSVSNKLSSALEKSVGTDLNAAKKLSRIIKKSII